MSYFSAAPRHQSLGVRTSDWRRIAGCDRRLADQALVAGGQLCQLVDTSGETRAGRQCVALVTPLAKNRGKNGLPGPRWVWAWRQWDSCPLGADGSNLTASSARKKRQGSAWSSYEERPNLRRKTRHIELDTSHLKCSLQEKVVQMWLCDCANVQMPYQADGYTQQVSTKA